MRAAPRRPHVQHDTAPSFALALGMHALLFVSMSFVVQWRTQDPGPVVAELWGALPPPAPAIEVAPRPPPPPPPVEQPKPEIKPPPEPPKLDPEISVQQEKKPPPKKEEPKKEEPKKEVAKKEAPKKDTPKGDLDKLLAQQVAQQAAKARAEEEARRRAETERMLAQAGPAATDGRSRGDPTYRARVIGCIRPHIVFAVPEGTSAGVAALFRVELLPDGTVADVRLVKPSGLAGYDAAAERAIRRCDPFPRPLEGTFERVLEVDMRPVER